MILDEYIDIRISTSNYKHYLSLDYKDVIINNIIKIKTCDLPKSSHVKVNVKCDICDNVKQITYRSYLNSYKKHNLYTCNGCKYKKVCLTNKEKYGVEYIFQNDNIKNKIKKTNKEKYGTENPSMCEKVKDKIRLTKNLKSNKENKRINEKRNVTNYNKYGVKNISQYIDVQLKKKEIIKNKIINENENIFNVNYDLGVYEMYCNICCNKFNIDINNYKNRKRIKTDYCTICNPINSKDSGYELQLKNFIKDNYDDIVFNSRNIISKELDIYIPKLKLAFEFNGLYWHNELHREKNYHLEKTEMCEQQNIQLIHIYEDDWLYKQNIVKSRILNLLGKCEIIYAEKCIIKNVNSKISKKFLDDNHIQGFVGSKYYIGLYYEDKLVSLMSFSKKRKNINSSIEDGEYELTRFCSKLGYTTIDGASKLFKYFIKTYNPKSIVSYVDRSWFKGDLYEKLGFKFINKTKPNYFYIINGIRKYRIDFNKDKLVREGYDKNKTEHEIMLERKIYRIFDSGNLKYIWESNKKC